MSSRVVRVSALVPPSCSWRPSTALGSSLYLRATLASEHGCRGSAPTIGGSWAASAASSDAPTAWARSSMRPGLWQCNSGATHRKLGPRGWPCPRARFRVHDGAGQSTLSWHASSSPSKCGMGRLRAPAGPSLSVHVSASRPRRALYGRATSAARLPPKFGHALQRIVSLWRQRRGRIAPRAVVPVQEEAQSYRHYTGVVVRTRACSCASTRSRISTTNRNVHRHCRSHGHSHRRSSSNRSRHRNRNRNRNDRHRTDDLTHHAVIRS